MKVIKIYPAINRKNTINHIFQINAGSTRKHPLVLEYIILSQLDFIVDNFKNLPLTDINIYEINELLRCTCSDVFSFLYFLRIKKKKYLNFKIL